MAQLKNTTISDTGFLRIPSGTTVQRPTPLSGQLRFNTSNNRIEIYNSDISNWTDLGYLNVNATGGNAVYDIEVEGTTYRVHVFTSTGNSTFTVSKGGEVEYLIVAGGGGGSGNFYDDGGGGGAGGLIAGKTTVTAQTYTITVGAGGGSSTITGGGSAENGGNSVAFGLTALGGGGGGSHRSPGTAGGSGGGGLGSFVGDNRNVDGGAATQPGSASGGFGHKGGSGGLNGGVINTGGYPGSGGGGGAGGEGRWPIGGGGGQGGEGGSGLAFNITGRNTFYAGGGGGLLGGRGVHGGADASGGRGTAAARPATPNTGGGGGGGRQGESDPGQPSNGGSGIVVIRYPVRQKGLSTLQKEVFDNSIVAAFDFSNQLSYPGVGSIVYDTFGNSAVGILVNSPPTREFRTHRSSFNFNGSNQHIRLESFLPRPSAQITCEAWVFPNRAVTTGTRRGAVWSNSASTYLGIFNSNDGGATHGLHWALQTSNSRTGGNNGSIPNQQWSHIVGTYDGSRTRGYVNGVLVYDVAQTGTVTDGTWYLGTYGQGINDGTHNWEGNIADAKMYNRALTQQEITNNFNVNRWRFGV